MISLFNKLLFLSTLGYSFWKYSPINLHFKKDISPKKIYLINMHFPKTPLTIITQTRYKYTIKAQWKSVLVYWKNDHLIPQVFEINSLSPQLLVCNLNPNVCVDFKNFFLSLKTYSLNQNPEVRACFKEAKLQKWIFFRVLTPVETLF